MSAPEFRILRIDEIDARVTPYAWPFVQERAADIARNWRERLDATPGMYDGRVLLMRDCAFETRGERATIRSLHFEAAFSAFLAWRNFGFPGANVRNCFAMAALRGADGGFILGEMGAHTANAGQIYFPAGTPDLSDIVGDRLDLAGSVVRELAEETGLRADEVSFARDWSVVDAGPRLACMRLTQVDAPAAEVAREIERRIATQTNPELARMHIVRDANDIDVARTPAFAVAWLRWMLGRATPQPG